MTLDTLALGSASPLPFLDEVVALIAAAALIAYLSQRIGLVPIVGFLIAGVAIGPNGLGLVRDRELVDAAAEVGIILLLFTIGLEFSLEKLARIQRLIFLGGGLQVGLTVGIMTALLTAFGVGWRAAVFTGCLAALSSTAIVLKLLQDRREMNTDEGQVAVGILLFQDLAVVAMVLLVPLLGGQAAGTGEIAWALVKAAGIVAGVLLVARRVMPRILEGVARACSAEIFLLSVIAICFGTAWLSSIAGVSVSLGAFLAGLVVSESRFRHYALSEILPLRILFSAVFFVSVGMLLDLSFLVRQPLLVAGVVAAVLAVKTLATAASVRVLGLSAAASVSTGLLLAQVGEFSFVLERTGREMGLFPAGMAERGGQAFIAATVVLMAVTPFLAQAGARLQRAGARMAQARKEAPVPVREDGAEAAAGHVVIAGYGDGARRLVRALRDAGVPQVILTLSPDGAREAELAGFRVIRGDYTRAHTLELADIEQARVVVVADDEPEMAERAVAAVKLANPELRVFVRARDASHLRALAEAGAEKVVLEEVESAARLVVHALGASGVAPERIEEAVEALRADAVGRAHADAPGEDEAGLLPVRLSTEQLSSPQCTHTEQAREVLPGSRGCEECLRTGDTWVHLRICMTCGHVGCCDSSKNKHASRHARRSAHPIIRSWEPGEDWAWCFVDETTL
jgi:monovalent cation:H+ antiporter-2, CPA2 family